MISLIVIKILMPIMILEIDFLEIRIHSLLFFEFKKISVLSLTFCSSKKKTQKYEVCPESIGPTYISPRWRYSSSSGGWHPSK